MLMDSQKVVTPVKTGVQTFCKCSKNLDSGFRRNDGKRAFGIFYEAVNVQNRNPATQVFWSLDIVSDLVLRISDFQVLRK